MKKGASRYLPAFAACRVPALTTANLSGPTTVVDIAVALPTNSSHGSLVVVSPSLNLSRGGAGHGGNLRSAGEWPTLGCNWSALLHL